VPFDRIFQRRDGILVTQQGLRRDDHQRLAQLAQACDAAGGRSATGRTGCTLPCSSRHTAACSARCGRRVLGPDLRSRAAASCEAALTAPLGFAGAMNWSITTWAPLAKSPNWASQITSWLGSAVA
jgi:hypothetical protein